MRKLSLTVIGLYLMFLSAFSQTTKKDTIYVPKPLKLEEVNIVSSYYSQDGIHSAVTGGIGSEKVTDFSNGLELKFVGYDMSNTKHSLSLEMGFDHHTAASSAYVNKTGASSTDGTRIYPSISWTQETAKGNAFGIGAYYSTEYNYKSIGVDFHGTHKISSNAEINAKVSGFFDQVKMIYPSELVPGTTLVTAPTGPSYYTTASGRTVALGSSISGKDKETIPSSARNTFTGSVAYSQIINKELQLSVNVEGVAQKGYLGLPFHRVYFKDGTAHVENLPDTRYKIPIGFRLNYFLGDNFVFRTYYRYYQDDWGITSHTAELEVPVKVNAFFSISPFYRYYTQTASKYFGAYMTHTASDKYFTSNYSLAELSSAFMGVGMHLAPPKGIFSEHLSTMEVRYGHYTQTTDLNANVISFAFTIK